MSLRPKGNNAVGEQANQPKTEESVFRVCREARGLELAGNYEEALAALSPFWEGWGARPQTAGLTSEAQGELLLRAGTLTGWPGSSNQVEGAQEAAKDLLQAALTIFEKLGLKDRVAETKTELG